MRLETVRIIAEWLQDATNGVNTKLASVPRDEGDPVPPSIEAIYDVTRHDWVVLRDDPPKVPCLYVMSEGGVLMTGEEMTGTFRETQEPFAITVRYVRQGGVSLAAATRDGDYTLRAVMRSVFELMKGTNVARRTRNSVCITTLDRATYVPIIEDVGNQQVTGAAVLEFTIRDAAPTG